MFTHFPALKQLQIFHMQQEFKNDRYDNASSVDLIIFAILSKKYINKNNIFIFNKSHFIKHEHKKNVFLSQL